VHSQLAAEYVPARYDFDHDRHVIAMEDLSDYEVWRGALNKLERHDGAAADMGIYVARVAFGTSAFGVEAKELKSRVAEALNPGLCDVRSRRTSSLASHMSMPSVTGFKKS
jgi:5-methylthioribose kinase